TQPALQFYTGNLLDGSRTGKQGRRYPRHAGFCLEPHHFPDSPHHADFPSTVLEPRATYRQTMVFRFGTR
ncbi:MAG: galactose-1-epimerase, partial [Gammaproteobacteria bacterium]|nr:galactose-1-epimerase [Gammaproteobacteria bacterium]